MQTNHLSTPASHARTKCALSSPQTSRLPLKVNHGPVYMLHVPNGAHRLHLATILFLSSTLSFSSRVRKIRCDGAKPVCFHCCQRGGNEQCSYDTLPKRRGPDRVQGARTRGTRPKEGDGVPPRRRRRRTATVDQDTAPPEAGSSDGTKRPPVTGNAPAPDILGEPVPDVHQQYAGVPNIPLEVSVFQSLGSGVRFNSTASHDPTLALYQNHVSDFRFVVIVWCSRIFSHMTQET